MSKALWIRQAYAIDPQSGREGTTDILVEKGVIAAIDGDLSGKRGLPEDPKALSPEKVQVVEAEGLLLTPGLIDLHVHLRVPGQAHKETMETGTRAAAAGGFTQILTLPNTQPVIDRPELVEEVLSLAKEKAVVRVHVAASVTLGQRGETLAPLGRLSRAGALAFTDDGRPVRDPFLMAMALTYARHLGKVILSHSEEPAFSRDGVCHQGKVALRLGLKGIPSLAESLGVMRDIQLALATGGRLHLMHLSTKESVEALRWGKAMGAPITAEVTPHHLALTTEELERWRYDPCTKVNPPLREEEDRQALVEALREGLIDIIATDHAPHSREEKSLSYEEAPFGISGLETAFPLLYETLVRPGHLKLVDLIRRLTVEPARLLGLPGGKLLEGEPADLSLFDLNTPFVVDPETFQSKGKNTPLKGRELRGRCVRTFVAGKEVWRLG